jgi:hypothetical protein
MAFTRARGDDRAMRVLTGGAASRSRLPVLPTLAALALGVGLIAAGVAAAWVALTSSVVTDVADLGRGPVVRPFIGMLAFAVAFLLPGGLVIGGLARLAQAFGRVAPRRRRKGPVASIRRRLPDDFTVVAGVRTPDGHRIPEVLVGPNGLIVVEALPPLRAVRVQGRSWEVRLSNGRWLSVEHPLDRAARDADRLRSWLSTEWESFSPRVHAAVVADGHDLARRPDVAVVTRRELAAFIVSMPASRAMTADRRAAILELFAAA